MRTWQIILAAGLFFTCGFNARAATGPATPDAVGATAGAAAVHEIADRDLARGSSGGVDPPGPPQEAATQMPHESATHMPPAPPRPRVVSPAARIVRNGFVSVQVNVDENGNNIVGDAANEPTIAMNPTKPDRMVIGWRQFDSIQSDFRQAGYAYTSDGGQSWTFPGVLTPGTFRSDPVMAADAEGNFYYYNIRCPYGSCGDIFRSFDDGVTWEGPFFAQGGDKVWMAVDATDDIGRGHVYAAWGGWFIRSTDGGLSFETGTPSSNLWGTITIDAEGVVYTVSHGGSISRSLNARDRSVKPVFSNTRPALLGGSPRSFDGPNPGGLLGQPWIASDVSGGPHRGSLYVLQSVDRPGVDPLDVMFTRSTDAGQSWDSPRPINNDGPNAANWQWFGTMSVSPQSGRIDVIWNDTRNSGGNYRLSELFYAYSTDGGVTWSDNVAVSNQFDSHLGWPRQNKLGDYYHMVSDELGGRLAYAATFNGEQDVYYVHIALDCNENGLHDGDDIAFGRSLDVNENGVPDECEVQCDLINAFNVKCRRGKLTALVKTDLQPGKRLTLDNNGDPREAVVKPSGKAKAKWTGQSGPHTVSIVECPDLTREVDCG